MTEATDKIEALYDWRHDLGGTNKEYMPIAQADVDLLGNHIDLTTAKACDVGCGGGAHLNALLEAGARFPVGIDLSGRALTVLLEGNDANGILLVRGDVTLWRHRQAFDAVICSLPPLAREGRMCLRAFTCTLYDLLNRGGVVLLKLFTRESVPSIVGSYAVHYEGATAVSCSDVSQAEHGRSMRIEQHFSDAPNDTRIEELALPARDDVCAALNEAGFVLQQMIDHTTASLPGTQTFIARA
jgi:SAM-dependent methyltransferase